MWRKEKNHVSEICSLFQMKIALNSRLQLPLGIGPRIHDTVAAEVNKEEAIPS